MDRNANRVKTDSPGLHPGLSDVAASRLMKRAWKHTLPPHQNVPAIRESQQDVAIARA
jgi:hypothetical protein